MTRRLGFLIAMGLGGLFALNAPNAFGTDNGAGGNPRCVSLGESGGDTSHDGGETTSSLFCCTPQAGYPVVGDDGTATCYNSGNLPGTAPGLPPGAPDTPTGGNPDDRPPTDPNHPHQPDWQPLECQPAARFFAPAAKLYGIENVRVGDVIELTEELRKRPGVLYVPLTSTEYAAAAARIAEKAARSPRPPCKETCRSCRKTRDDSVNRSTAEFDSCIREHKNDAEHYCAQGVWRNDPRHDCGMFESSDFCGTPGQAIQADDCTNYIEVGVPPHNHMQQVCEETPWMTACKQSWMGDIPRTVAEHHDGSTTVGATWGIGSVQHTFGSDVITTTIEPGKGFQSACVKLDQKFKDKVRGPDYAACVARVQAANPGVTCDP